MKIGIDARMWNESGIGRYIRNLTDNLFQIDHENEYVLFILSNNDLVQDLPSRVSIVVADFPWYSFSEQIKFPQLIQKTKIDLMHFPHFNVPIFYNGPFIVTIHDLIHQHFKMKRATRLNPIVYQFKHFSYKRVFNHALKNSQKIITVSDYVRVSLIKDLAIPEGKIVVTKEGVEDKIINLAKVTSLQRVSEVLKKFEINQKYIFYVGNAHPHKNVEGLIRAFLAFKKKMSQIKDPQEPDKSNSNLQLVLAGNDHYFWKRIKEQFAHPEIIYPGFVTDEELVCLYKGAEAFVMPSFEEGFGIPILEAMACGTPVISSNKASLPEVGGDACLYFDPANQAELIDKILQLLNSTNLKQELIKKGEKRFKQFSWQEMAKETLKEY